MLCWNVLFPKAFFYDKVNPYWFFTCDRNPIFEDYFFFVNTKILTLINIKIIQWTIYVTVKALSTFLKKLELKTSSSKFFIGDWKSLLIRYRLQFRWKFVCNFHFVKKCAFTKDINREINVPWKKILTLSFCKSLWTFKSPPFRKFERFSVKNPPLSRDEGTTDP